MQRGLIYVDLTSSQHVRILYVAPLAFFYCDDDQLGLLAASCSWTFALTNVIFFRRTRTFRCMVLFVKQKELVRLDRQPVKNTSYIHPYG
jgi:hypothetical protein